MKKIRLLFLAFVLIGMSSSSYAQTIKLLESFEGATFPPTGWTSVSQLGPKVWARVGELAPLFPPYPDGIYCATIDYESAGGDDWLITPQISNVSVNDSLVFYFVKKFSDGPYIPDSMFVKVSTLTNSIADFTTTIQSTCIHCIPVGQQVWNRVSLSLSSFVGQNIYIAFQHKNVDAHGIGLDQVSVFAPSLPTDLAIIQDDVNECDPIGVFAPPITIKNVGTATVFASSTFIATYSVNQGTPVVETLTIPADLLPGNEVELYFTTPYLIEQFITYHVRYAIDYLGDANTANDTVLFDVSSHGYPIVDLGPDTTICHDVSIILDAGNPGALYNWSTGADTQTIELNSSPGVFGTFTIWVEVTENDFCMTLDEINVTWQDCTGIELFENLEVSIMPNPTNGEFLIDFLEIQGTVIVEISDFQGKIILSESLDLNGNQNQRYDLSSFANGIYNIRITNDNKQKVLKIIKQ